MADKRKTPNVITFTTGDYDRDEMEQQIHEMYDHGQVPVEVKVYRKNPKNGVEAALYKFDYLPDEFDDLQPMFGGGVFRLFIRWSNPEAPSERTMRTKNVVIEGEPKDFRPGAQQNNPQQLSALNAKEQMVADLKFAKEMLGTGGNDNTAIINMMIESNKQSTMMMIESSKQSATMFTTMMTAMMAQKGDPLAQKLIEKVVTTGFDKANTSEIDSYFKIQKLLGAPAGDGDVSWAGLIKEFIPVLPGVIGALTAGNQSAQPVRQPQRPVSGPNSPIPAPSGAENQAISSSILEMSKVMNQNFKALAGEIVQMSNKLKAFELEKYQSLCDDFSDESDEAEKLQIFKDIVNGLGPEAAYKIFIDTETLLDIESFNDWNKKAGLPEYLPAVKTEGPEPITVVTGNEQPAESVVTSNGQNNNNNMDIKNKIYAASINAMTPDEKLAELKKNIDMLGVKNVYDWCLQWGVAKDLADFNDWMKRGGYPEYVPQ